MGRRKLLPNINNLLLQLHLTHRHADGKANENDSKANQVTEGPSPNEDIPHNEELEDDSASHNHNDAATSTPHHNNHHNNHNNHLHIFTWPSLKRRPSSSSLASTSTEDDHDSDDHESDHDIQTEPPSRDQSLGGISFEEETAIPNHNHSSHKSVVSFGNCQVRTYTQVLGDHPCCLEGCPIQLGWSYTAEELYKVDDYERFYHTIDGGLQPKYTDLHELRLSPEERRSILILSKQQEYVNNANTNTVANTSDAETNCGGEESTCGDENDACADSSNKELSAEDAQYSNSNAAGTTSCPSSQLLQHCDPQQHERELRRECRRLHRCGGWNVNVKASRKRNKRNQEAFFGCSATTSTTKTSIERIQPEDPTTSTTEINNDGVTL